MSKLERGKKKMILEQTKVTGDLPQSWNSQSDVHFTAASEMESVQSHLSRRLTNRLETKTRNPELYVGASHRVTTQNHCTSPVIDNKQTSLNCLTRDLK